MSNSEVEQVSEDPPEEPQHLDRVAERRLHMELASMSYTWQGPPPEVLERYAAIYPDAPRVIFQGFEEQGRHRREMEAKLLDGSEKRATRGQFLGASILFVAILGGIFLAWRGDTTAGLSLIGGALATGALSYVFGDFAPGRKGNKK